MSNLEQALIDSGQAETEKEANEIVRFMLNRLNNFEDADDILEFYGLEGEFKEEDIRSWKQYGSKDPQGESGASSASTQIPQKSDSEKDKIAYKIKMLIEKANSTDSQAEKDACMMKAQELIQKHSIESTRIGRAGGDKSRKEEDIIEEHVKYEEEWDRNLIKNVAKGNMCKIIFETAANKIYVIGEESSVNAVIGLCGFYRKAILNLAVEAAKKKTRLSKMLASQKRGGIGTRELAVIEKAEVENIKDYLLGAVDGLEDALNKKNEAFRVERFVVEESDGEKKEMTGGEVMIISRNRIDEYITKKYPYLGRASFNSSGGNQNSSAYGRGHADGSGLGSSQRRIN